MLNIRNRGFKRTPAQERMVRKQHEEEQLDLLARLAIKNNRVREAARATEVAKVDHVVAERTSKKLGIPKATRGAGAVEPSDGREYGAATKKPEFVPGVGRVLTKQQWDKPGYGRLPRLISRSAEYQSLTFAERDLLAYLIDQYTGHNNGKLTASLDDLHRKWGWARYADKLRSNSLRNLFDLGLVEETRKRKQGQSAHLALTWVERDDE